AGATVGAREGVSEEFLAALGLVALGLVALGLARERQGAGRRDVVARGSAGGVGAGTRGQSSEGERAQQPESERIHRKTVHFLPPREMRSEARNIVPWRFFRGGFSE